MTKQSPRGRGRPPGPPTKAVNFRLSPALIERIDRYVDSEARWTTGRETNRTRVVVAALESFLDGRGF